MRCLAFLSPLLFVACDPHAARSPAPPSAVLGSAPETTGAPAPATATAAPIVFANLFLEAHDIPTAMRNVKSVEESRPDDSIFICFGGPAGRESAISEWGDPDGREPLWRIVDLRWVFDDEAGAKAFHASMLAHFEGKHFKVAPCTAEIGETCSRAYYGDWTDKGEPHIEIGYLFRIGNVLAEVAAGEGPRIGKRRMNDDLVLPFAKRAEERIRAALPSGKH